VTLPVANFLVVNHQPSPPLLPYGGLR